MARGNNALSPLLLPVLLPALLWARDPAGVGFSNNPQGKTAEQVVLQAIASAEESIHVAAYQLTARSITQR